MDDLGAAESTTDIWNSITKATNSTLMAYHFTDILDSKFTEVANSQEPLHR